MGITGLLKHLSPLLTPENEINNNNGDGNNKKKQTRSSSSSSPNYYNIRQFANKSVAIDASSWLFKAAYSCAESLVEAIERNEIDPSSERRLCNYMTKRCDELLTHASIKRVYLVFDGKRCPLKEVTNIERETKRRENLKEARRLKGIGRGDLAGDKYRGCLKVTSWMADSVAKAVERKWGGGNGMGRLQFAPPQVCCVFSPYEADAQLVKLCMDGLTDAIITEDSDVLVYSAACNLSIPIIYKLSRDDGSCDVLTMDWLLSSNDHNDTASSSSSTNGYSSCPSIRRVLPSCQSPNETKGKCTSRKAARSSSSSSSTKKKPKGAQPLLSHLTAMTARERREKGSGARMFVQACVLTGCDYAPSRLAGVGLVTAFKMMKENAHRDVDTRFHHVLTSFPRDKILPDETTTNMGGGSSSSSSSMNHEGKQQIIKKEDISNVIQSYESILAKSEAVFYYHRVCHMATGKVVPLVEPPSSEVSTDSSEVTKDRNQFLPSTARFGGDISFTGCDDTVVTLSTNISPNVPTIPPSQAPTKPYTVKNKPSFFGSQALHKTKVDYTYSTKVLSKVENKSSKKPGPIHSFLKASQNGTQTTQTTQTKGRQSDSIELGGSPKGIFSQYALKGRQSSSIKLGGSPKGIFSQYAYKSGNDNNHNKSRNHGKENQLRRKRSLATYAATTSRQRHTKLDSDSDEYLDESNDHFYSSGRTNFNRNPVITPSVKSSQSSCSSISSVEEVTTTSSTVRRSKYFNLEDDIDTNNDSDNSWGKIGAEASSALQFTTPKKGNMERDERKKLLFQDEILHNTNDESADESSNDCVIVDAPFSSSQNTSFSSKSSSFMEKNSRKSIFERFQSQSQSQQEEDYSSPNDTLGSNNMSFSSIDRASKNTGTYGRFTTHQGKAGPTTFGKTKRKQNSTGLPSAKKRVAKAGSIRSFFLPLNTTRQS